MAKKEKQEIKTDGWKETLPANVGWRSNPPFLPAFFWAAGGFQNF